MKNKLIFTTKQVSDILGYTSDATVRQMIARDKIEAEKFGSVWMIEEKEVERLKKEGYGGKLLVDNDDNDTV